MRICRMIVTKLFGMFDHTVDFNLQERITIIHGVNGIGKTALLRLLDAVFNKQVSVLSSIPFETFRIDFEDGSYLALTKTTKTENNHEASDSTLTVALKESGKKIFRGPVGGTFEARDLQFPSSFFERYVPGLRRIGPNQWQYFPTNEILGIDGIVRRFGNRLPLPRRYRQNIGFPEQVDQFLDKTHVRLIRAQRLLVLSEEVDDAKYREEDRRPKVSEAVERYSLELRDKIKAILTQSSTLSQSLDRTFPQRLLDSYGNLDQSIQVSKEDLLRRLQNVEKKRTFLTSVGLYDAAKEKIENPVLGDENINRVLAVYVEDTEKKLEIFDALADKISALTEVINGRFQYKKMEIDKEKGFVFRINDERLLSPTDLSSGEQHEIVLVYELLFQTGPDTLVLIDEPELSLHVGWQIKFLEDLKRIIDLSRIDVLIATHSPQIINNHWDLTVKLGSQDHD